MPLALFYAFAVITAISAICLISLRNPVASAISMVAAFAGLAAIFVSLDAFFVSVIQILVYAGAIMVLFIFIIMLLDLKNEEKRAPKILPLVAGITLVGLFILQLSAVLSDTKDQQIPELAYAENAARYETGEDGLTKSETISKSLADNKLPDVHLIGRELFTNRAKEMQIVGVILLVATIGTVVLSKRQTS